MAPEFFDMQGQPITLEEWGRSRMHVEPIGLTVLEDGAEVSTVWLGLDLRFGRGGLPLIFETMVFGGEHDLDCWRYSTLEQARAGHDRVVADLEAAK